MDYYLFWLIAVAFSLLAGVTLVVSGSRLMKQGVEDYSNSISLGVFVVRLLRLLPGAVVGGVGVVVLWKIIGLILSLPLPLS